MMTVAELWKKSPLAWMILAVLLAAVYAPVYPRMIGDWMHDPNYSHGFLVPFISAWFVWRAWPDLVKTPVKPANAGFITLIFGLLLLAVGVMVDELYTSRISLIVILAGMVHALLGAAALRLLALPLAFLLFMVPLPYTVYDALALPLKSLVSMTATWGLKACGLPVIREGNMIIFPNISLEVVEACSGMRSLVSLMALGTACAFLFLKSPPRRALLIALTIPIAVFTNVTRVFVTGALARHLGAAAAEGFFHDFAGMAVFVTALALTFLAGWLLGKAPGIGENRHEA